MAGPNPQLSITAIQSSSRRNALPQFSQRRNLLAVEIIPKHPVPAGFEDPLLTPADYTDLYDESIRDPEAFWGREGKRGSVVISTLIHAKGILQVTGNT